MLSWNRWIRLCHQWWLKSNELIHKLGHGRYTTSYFACRACQAEQDRRSCQGWDLWRQPHAQRTVLPRSSAALLTMNAWCEGFLKPNFASRSSAEIGKASTPAIPYIQQMSHHSELLPVKSPASPFPLLWGFLSKRDICMLLPAREVKPIRAHRLLTCKHFWGRLHFESCKHCRQHLLSKGRPLLRVHECTLVNTPTQGKCIVKSWISRWVWALSSFLGSFEESINPFFHFRHPLDWSLPRWVLS